MPGLGQTVRSDDYSRQGLLALTIPGMSYMEIDKVVLCFGSSGYIWKDVYELGGECSYLLLLYFFFGTTSLGLKYMDGCLRAWWKM